MNHIVLTFIVLCIVVCGVSLLSMIHPLLAFAAFMTFAFHMNEVLNLVGSWVLRVRSEVSRLANKVRSA